VTHDYHEGLPTYNAEAVLQEGCGECEYRANSGTAGLLSLDINNFARLWDRAIQLESSVPFSGDESSLHVSRTTNAAEREALRTVWQMALLLHNNFGLPFDRLELQAAVR
jgi:hypothetical protein